MTDYHRVIARAVGDLDENNGKSRRGLYERARTTLVAQLRRCDPPLPESEITRERLSLEEAIRNFEAEVTHRERELAMLEKVHRDVEVEARRRQREEGNVRRAVPRSPSRSG